LLRNWRPLPPPQGLETAWAQRLPHSPLILPLALLAQVYSESPLHTSQNPLAGSLLQ
jgi:hypothetical protein